MNSFLQIILHTPGFLKELKKVIEEKNINSALINNIISLSEDPKNNGFLRNIKFLMGKVDSSFDNCSQNDSQEFGNAFIDEIVNLIKGKKSYDNDIETQEFDIILNNKPHYNKEIFEKYIKTYFNEELILENMFLIHESLFKIENKQNESKKIKNIDFNSSFNIELSFPKNPQKTKYNLIELLKSKYLDENNLIEKKVLNKDYNLEEKNELEEENIKESNKIEKKTSFIEKLKNFCNNIIEKIKRIFSFFKNKKIIEKENYEYITKLASLPKILIISINRAIFKKELYDNILEYNDILDVINFVDENACETKFTKYKLYGINECCGNLVNSGHYYSYINIKGEWHKFDDRKVNDVKDISYSSKYVVGLYYIKY